MPAGRQQKEKHTKIFRLLYRIMEKIAIQTISYIFSWMAISVNLYKETLYNFPLHTHEKIFPILVAIVGLDTCVSC